MKTSIKKISSALMVLLIACSSLHATLTITPTITPACQSGTGAVTFTVTGGSGGYSYYLYNIRTGGGYAQQTSPTFTNLQVSDYRVYVTGSLDSGYLQFYLPAAVTGSITTTPATCAQHNGVLTVTPSSGTSPFTYRWDDPNNSTTATITNGIPGYYYSAYITDANGCVSDSMVALEGQTSPVSVSISSSGSLCNQTLTAVATGGGPTYSYQWSTGATTAALTGVNATGTYRVTATEPNGCAAAQSISVTATNLTLDSTNTALVNPSCGANGSITITMNTGVAPYSYQWSPVSGTTNAQSNLSAGAYYVTVTDANGCRNSNVFYLQLNQLSSVQICNFTYPDCGSANGSLTACAYGAGGTPTYLWSGGEQTATINGLAAGTYSVTASYLGCSVSASVALRGRANYQVNVTTTPSACDSAIHSGTATAVISGTGGTGPYTFEWHGAWYPTTTAPVIGYGQTISGLSLGEFIYADVTDANGCIPVYSYDSAYINRDPACYDHITGYVYTDVNANCIHDAGDYGQTGLNVSANSPSGNAYYASPDSSGYYDIWVTPGVYTVRANFYSSGPCVVGSCVSSYQDTFTAVGQTITGNDIGIGGQSTFDLGVHMGYQGSAPGQQREYWVYYYNWGHQSVANGTLTFVYDANITLASTSPAYTTHNAATHTITWDIVNNLGPMYWLDAQHKVTMTFDIPSSLALGTLLTAHADISPVTADCDPSDNSQDLTDVVSASHDPNEKEVSPAGNLTAGDTLLTYTLRFQNTGNAPANLVVIKDTLSSNVDASTVKPGASSAPYQFAISGNGILTFTFSNINLPDSSHGDSSKGFVVYTVRVKKNLPLGAVINNTGYIYFDANPAVVTNTTSSLRSDFPSSISTLKGSAMSAQVQPNPAHDRAVIEFHGATGAVDMQITDALGQTLLSTTVSSGSYALEAEHFAPGMYFYTAKDAAGNKASGKISIVR